MFEKARSGMVVFECFVNETRSGTVVFWYFSVKRNERSVAARWNFDVFRMLFAVFSSKNFEKARSGTVLLWTFSKNILKILVSRYCQSS